MSKINYWKSLPVNQRENSARELHSNFTLTFSTFDVIDNISYICKEKEELLFCSMYSIKIKIKRGNEQEENKTASPIDV